MGDLNRGPISPTEKQYLKDLETATRLSLDEYEREKRRWSKPFPNNFSRKVSSTQGSQSDDKSHNVSSSLRPRPFSRTVSTTDSPTSVSSGRTLLQSPVSINPPPESALRRNRSLPYRYRNNSSKQGETSSKVTSNGVNSKGTGETPVSNVQTATLNTLSDDLIVFSSPKASPKFPHLNLTAPSFTEDSPNSAPTALRRSSLLSPSSTTSGTPSFLLHSSPTTSPGFHSSPVQMEPYNFNSSRNAALNSPITYPLTPAATSSHPAVAISNTSLSPTVLPTSTAYTKLSQQLKSMSCGDDLIDLGQSDGRNILEYFDPLILKEKVMENKNTEKSDSSKENTVMNTKGKTSPPTMSRQETCRDSSISRMSICSGISSTTATSFSFHPGPSSLSLYPSLQEFTPDSIYPRAFIEKEKDDDSSFYDVYNHLEYLYEVSCSSASASSFYDSVFSQYGQNSDTNRPIGFSQFVEILKSPAPSSTAPPALPPRNLENPQLPQTASRDSPKVPLKSLTTSDEMLKNHGRLYENIESVKHSTSTDSELQAFFEMIKELRFSNRHVDSTTNVGFVRSSTLESKCMEALSIKVIVWNDDNIPSEPAAFTCDVSTTADLVVDQALIDLEIDGSGRDYILRVKGMKEFLAPEVPLAKFRYVQECIKIDQDIQLILVLRAKMEQNSWARTPRDDAKCVGISVDDILPEKHARTITHKDISIPLEVIDRESERLKEKLSGITGIKDLSQLALNSSALIQPVKAVCVLLGEVQTVEITECLDNFAAACNDWNTKVKSTATDGESRRRTKIVNDCSSRHSFVEILPRSNSLGVDEELKDLVLCSLYRLEDSVRHLVEMYSKSFPVSFRMKEPPETVRVGWNSSCKPMSDMIESFLVRIGAVHRLKPEWLTTYPDYILKAEVFHGARWMAQVSSPVKVATRSDNNIFFHTVVFHTWMNFEHLPVCILPRESRIVFSLYGRKPREDNNSVYEAIEIGWTSMQCFNFKGLLAQGKYLLPLWPKGLVQKKLGPAPDSAFSSDAHAPLLTIEFTDFGYDLPFPEVPTAKPPPRDFNSLDPSTQILLKDICENSPFTKIPADEREVFWEKRHYLREFPNALPKVLLAAQLWDYASLAELHAMLEFWEPLEPIDALQLLLPCFPDAKVREQGIKWVSNMSDEELINLMPQLVEALSFETFDFSPLARFLLKKALSCLKISHYLFWLLASQVGLGKWAEYTEDRIISKIPTHDGENVYDPKRRRLELMLNSLMVISGAKWKQALISQYRLMEGFYDVAAQVKSTSSSSRQTVLLQELNKVQIQVMSSGTSFPLPLSPSYDVTSIDIKASSYFTSASVPLKVVFNNALAEKGQIATIYKVGDDLRQDMLTIQIIRVVEKWWLESGLDLRILTFTCVPTGVKQGFVEMVPNAETLCRIQAEHGLTGAFRNRPISEWLAKMNPSTLDYRRAIENFTLSCAAYCVVTYILGICDRHNDNIMLTKKGHLFHIDFGKFLGDAQMFGNLIKRDRSPFVLTSDMVYVINDGEKDSSKFHRFVELCCQAFRVVRQNGNTLLNLFALMATAGIPGVDTNSVKYIQNALLPELSNSEAAARFASFIQESLQNWFTPVNFFLHTLAQMPFQMDSNDDPTKLSFVPTVYSMETDGRIERAELLSYLKKYDPEKFYVYTIRIKRKAQGESILHRSYKEFLEFHSKLCINFPKAVGTLRNLPRGSGLSRSNVKQVTEKRKQLLQQFLESLFSLADEISHSQLVYTFFHPLLRDEDLHQEDELERKASARTSLSRNPARIHGQIKLSLEYERGALHVLILHAVDLACPNNMPPSPYVKTYLQPDPGRTTKRKTKVVKKNQHPTFMEMIQYRLPLDLIKTKVLAVSVWHHDPFQENNFLGGIPIPMSCLILGKELTKTYTLGNIVSTA